MNTSCVYCYLISTDCCQLSMVADWNIYCYSLYLDVLEEYSLFFYLRLAYLKLKVALKWEGEIFAFSIAKDQKALKQHPLSINWCLSKHFTSVIQMMSPIVFWFRRLSSGLFFLKSTNIQRMILYKVMLKKKVIRKLSFNIRQYKCNSPCSICHLFLYCKQYPSCH